MEELLQLFINNGWQAVNAPGTIMLLIVMAFVIVNIFKNKKLNLMQLVGNVLILVICFIFVKIRR